MRLPALSSLLLPLAILLIAHALGFAWRALPPSAYHKADMGQWQLLPALTYVTDVRKVLLAGNHWGNKVDSAAVAELPDTAAKPIDEDAGEAARQILSKKLQAHLQGIIYRGEWVLLFAQDAAGQQATPTDQPQETPAGQQGVRPLELRAGEQLPGTHWSISQVWPDRIELQHPTEHTITLPLYPLADPVTEP